MIKTIKDFYLKLKSSEKPFYPILFFIFIVFIIQSIKKLLIVGFFGQSDLFLSILNFLYNNDIKSKFPQILLFMGSFYSVVLWPIICAGFLIFYTNFLQAVIHMMSPNPIRMSKTLTILFSAAGVLYLISLIPIFGGLFYFLAFMYLSSKELGNVLNVSTLKGVMVLCAPFIIGFMVLGIGFLLSIAGIASVFSF